MDIDGVNEAGKAIHEVLETYTYGCRNDEALTKVNSLADGALKLSDNDPYVSEKVASIKSFAAILYSVRKHERYGGAEKVRSIIFSDAYRLRTWDA